MRKELQFVIIVILISLPLTLFSQNFSWQADTTTKTGDPGNTILFHTYLINNTASQLDLRVIRTVNNLPSGWFSSFCVGGITGTCYAPNIDTVPDPVVVNASSQLELAIDVITSINPDQGDITVRVEEWNNPSNFLTESFAASTLPTKIRHTLPVTGEYQLYTNYPNPFNPSTTIPFEIGGNKTERTIIVVYNVVGQRIKTIFDGYLSPGIHNASWDGQDAMGRPVSSGIYFLEFRTEQHFMMGKMFLLK
jgi:hypothetical protein